MVSADGQHLGVPHAALEEERQVRGPAADIDDDHAELLLLGREHGPARRERLQHQVVYAEPGARAALDDILDRRHRAGDDVDLHVEPRSRHPVGVLDPVLVVDDELLGEHMEDLLVHGDVHRPGAVDRPRDVCGTDLPVLDRGHAARIDPLDVAAGDPHVHRVDLHAGHKLGLVDRFFDGLHGAVDIHDHAFFQAVGRADADPDDVDLSAVLDLAHNGADLGRPQVQTYEHIIRFFCHRAPPS